MGLNVILAPAKSAYSNVPAVPKPLTGEGYPSEQTGLIAHPGTLIDGVLFESTTSIRGRLKNVNVWQVVGTDISPYVDAIIARGISNWYDGVNDRLYIFGLDKGPAPNTLYTSYITLETGALTNLGSTQLTADFTPSSGTPTVGDMHVNRVAEDSGNLTLSTTAETVVISSTNGSEVSHTIETNSTESTKLGNYVTADGTIYCSTTMESYTNQLGAVTVTKSGVSTRVPMLRSTFTGGSQNTEFNIYVMLWSDKVKTVHTNAASVPILKTFERSAFDKWVEEVAARGGL